MKLHYLQHVSFENPGIILSWAKGRNYPLTVTHLYKNETLPSVNAFDWLIVMGGPMNIYEETAYPWLVEEKKLIKEAILKGKLVLGLCLGGQLIADAIGGRVVKNIHQEIGWFPVEMTKEALQMPLFSHLPPKPVIFEWHGDTFVDLPQEAILLASNEACKNQAFAVGSRVFGFQYHMENTLEIIVNLIKNCEEEMIAGPYVQQAETIMEGTEYIKQNQEWMQLFLSKMADLYEKGEI